MDFFIYKSYAYSFKAAQHSLKLLEEDRDGKFYNSLSTILFSILTLESYINHKCQKEIKNYITWDEKEKPKIKQKLKKLYKNYEVEIDFNKKPFSQISLLFKIRDSIVHGKTITTKKNVKKPPNNSKQARENLSSNIEKYCKPKKAKEINKMAQTIIEKINSESNHTESKTKLWSLGSGSYKVKKKA